VRKRRDHPRDQPDGGAQQHESPAHLTTVEQSCGAPDHANCDEEKNAGDACRQCWPDQIPETARLRPRMRRSDRRRPTSRVPECPLASRRAAALGRAIGSRKWRSPTARFFYSGSAKRMRIDANFPKRIRERSQGITIWDGTPCPLLRQARRGRSAVNASVRCAGMTLRGPGYYRFENWKLRRAFALPYFLRSTTRGSRVRKPPRLSTARKSGSCRINALDRP